MKIKGSVVLVTGGASGLGEATVREVVARGGRAVIADLNEERGEHLAKELGEAARFAKADVSNAADVEAALGLAGSLGTLRAAVSCAGIRIGVRTIDKTGDPTIWPPFRRSSRSTWSERSTSFVSLPRE